MFIYIYSPCTVEVRTYIHVFAIQFSSFIISPKCSWRNCL